MGLVFQDSYGLDGTFASLTANEQAALEVDVQQAENDLSAEFTNSVTAKVDVEAINVPLVDGSGFIASNAASAYRAVTLSTYFAALQSVATTAYQTNAVAAIKSLTDDTGGNYVLLPSAYANMLGLGNAGTFVSAAPVQFTQGGPTYNLSSSVDDTVFLNLAVVQTALDAQTANTPNDSIVAVIEHELTENVMGRISSLLSASVGGSIGAVWEPADFFRVNSAGQSDLTPNTTTPIFFSPDPGVTGPVSSLQFNNSSGAGDFADWTTTSTSDPAYTDPLGAGGFNGAVGTETSQLSPTDIDLMNVLGWTIATGGGSTPSLTLGLKTDTGASTTDKLTSAATLTGVATPNATVTLTENGATLGTATADAGGAWTFTPTLADGAHTITASEPAGAGQPLTASLTFTLATKAPTVNASESVSGSTSLTSDTITISAVAESVGANAIAGVEIFDGNADLGSAVLSGGSWTFAAQNLLAGTHTFTVKATDLAGDTTSTTLAAVTVTTSAPPVSYVLSAFTFTGDLVTDIRPKGINDSGEVVGYYIDARADAVGADGLTYDEHGFVSTINSGVRQYYTIDNPISPTGLPLVQTRAFAVNDSGDIVGWYSQQGYATADNGSTYALPTAGFIDSANWPGAVGTLSYSAVGDYGTHTLGINASDEIVGFYYDGSGEQHGFLRNFTGYGVRGGYVSFDPANSINTVAEGINDSGEIVGFYEAADKTVHGFTYNSLSGVFATIDVNGATSTEALGVNDSGDVVGTYFDSAGIRHGYVRGPNGQVTTIDDPNAGAGGTLVGGINNRGEIVGWYTGTDGHDHGFTGLPAAPTLVISAATGPSTVALSGSIDAADNDATIGIYDGATLLTTTTANASGAWSANVLVAAVGAHILTARATNAGGAGISNAVVDLVNASDSLSGGAQVVVFSSSGDAVALSNSAGAWDHVSGSNGVISINAAQVGVSGSGDTIDFVGGAGNVASLSWTGAGTYIINGFTSGDVIDIAGFTTGDAIDLVGLTSAYSPTTTNGCEPSSATLTVAGNVVTQVNADGSRLSSHFNISGQAYTTIVRTFDASGDLTSVEHEGVTGAPYTAYTTLYSGPGSTGNIVSGNELFYTNQASGLTEVDLDGSGNLTRALYAYAGTAPGSETRFEADYVAGEFAGGVATYLALAGATYSTFEAEYDNHYQYVGAIYTFNSTGQTYDEAQYAYTAGSQPKLTEATFSQYTGSGGPSVASFFYDNNGATAGSQYSYTGIVGQAYISDTLLYNSANVLIAAEYGGYATKPFSSQTTFYNSSGVAQQVVRDFTGPTAAGSIAGQAYDAYEKILDPAFTLLATAYRLDNGGNVYVGVASGVSSPTFGGTGVSANTAELSNTLTGGDWTITGGGTGESFTFASFFNKAEITDYGATFGAATDIVSVSTQDFADWTTMLSDAAPSGGGANTTFTSTTTGDKLTLDGVTVAQLQLLSTSQANADFLFHA